MPIRSTAALATVLATLLAAPAPLWAQPGPLPQSWPHERSDLKPDAGVRFGTLPNGLKYAVMANKTPPGEASIRLRIDAGSLSESEQQRGVAHFLEHMAFNGSKSVPEGEMVRILERQGLAFGPDTNAYTDMDETVYQLDLPEANAKTLDTGLFLMRELAGELLLDAKAIDRERGVILSEERARDNPGYRTYRKRLEFFLKGQRPPQRVPIGEPEVIKGAPREAFLDFYQRHYRPDLATVVVVGDVDPAEAVRQIEAKFGDWRPAAGKPTVPDLGAVAKRTAGETELTVEPGGGLTLQIGWVSPPDLDPDTRAKRIADTPESIGFAVLNRRLERLARGAEPPFIAASAGRGNEYDAAEITTISVSADPDKWRPALQAAEREQRRLVQFGVLQSELDREVREYRTALQARVAGVATRRSPALAAQIIGAVDGDYVFTAPADELALFDEAVKGLTAEKVSTAVREAFAGQGPLVFFASPAPIQGGETAVAAAVAESRQVAVTAPVLPTTRPWPYADWGTPGKVAERTRVEDLDTTFVRFENGVRLTVKPTKLRDDQILTAVRVGDGRLDVPADRLTVAWAAPGAVSDGGTKELTNEEIDSILAGKVVGASFAIDDDAFLFSGRTRPEDFATQLQLLTAVVAKPGLRPEAFERMRTYGATMHRQLEATPNGVLQRDLGQLMRGGDLRWAFPDAAAIAASKPQDLRALLEQPLAGDPIEVVIVGDVELERAIAETAKTFGALPARKPAAPPPPAARQLRFPAGTSTPVLRTHKGRADQALAYAAWPTQDFFADPQAAREARLLEAIMDLRLTDELREAQGATYSPFTGFASSFVYPGYGYLAAGVEMPADKLAGFLADVKKIAANLREKPVSADELERARKPRIEAIQRAQAGNEYWLAQLSGAQADPRRLDAVRQSITGLEKVTAADIQRAARRWLSDDKLWTLNIVPAAGAAGAAAQPVTGSPVSTN